MVACTSMCVLLPSLPDVVVDIAAAAARLPCPQPPNCGASTWPWLLNAQTIQLHAFEPKMLLWLLWLLLLLPSYHVQLLLQPYEHQCLFNG